MAHISTLKSNSTSQTSPNLEDLYTGVHQAIKSGSQNRLMNSLQNLAALKGPQHAQLMVDELLPNVVAQIEGILSERFSQNKSRTTTQTNRIWKSLGIKRELYSAVVSSINTHADRYNIAIPENLAVQSHLPLLVGPLRFAQPLQAQIKVLDSMLNFTERFVDYERGKVKDIAKQLAEIGTANLLKERGVKGTISAQRICDVVMKSYGFAPVPVRVSSKNDENTSYNSATREIIIKADDFHGLSNELKVNVLLHEARHAIQVHLIDNMLWRRRDGSPNFYRHHRIHEIVKEFPSDVGRMFVSAFARRISSDLVVLSESAIQALYAAQTSEKDADRFAAHILATLTKRDSESIIEEYRSISNKETSGSPKKKEPSNLAKEIETVTSSLILPSRENSWGAGLLREATLETLVKSKPEPKEKDPYEHLLIRAGEKK